MLELLFTLIPIVCCYLYAKEMKERYYDLEMANPIWYAVGGFCFGFIPMLYLWNNIRLYRKYRY